MERAKRHLELLPLRVRLVAVMVVLLLLALTLTASATAALMRRDLMGRVDDDLQRAYPTVAQQALNTLRAPARNRLPSGYAVVFYPTDGTTPVEIDPTGASARPGVPDTLAITDPRVSSTDAFTIGTRDGSEQWRAVAGSLKDGSATFVVAVPLASVNHTVQQARPRSSCSSASSSSAPCADHGLVCRAARLPAAAPDRGHRGRDRRRGPRPPHPHANRQGRGHLVVAVAQRDARADRAVLRGP